MGCHVLTHSPFSPTWSTGPTASSQSITTKLETLMNMMNNKLVTPFDRLKLLREVTEDARVFRLGGEDKIRVATGTCETVRCLLIVLA